MGSLLSLFFGWLCTWCAYKGAFTIFGWITKSGKNNYNIKPSSCKYAMCFTCNILISSCTCCFHRLCNGCHECCDREGCSSSKKGDQEQPYSDSGSASEELTGDAVYFAVPDEDPSSSNGDVAALKLLHRNKNDSSKVQSSKVQTSNQGNEVLPDSTERIPSDVLEKFAGEERPTTEQTFTERYERIINKLASRVTFQKFYSDHRRYSKFLGRMSHKGHCKSAVCRAAKHKEFQMTKGLRLQPVIHFLVVNWVELLYLRKKIEVDRQKKRAENGNKSKEHEDELLTLFRLMLPEGNSGNPVVETEWKDNLSTTNAKHNVWLTLLNFPEPSEIRTLEEISLREQIVKFFFTLEVCNANLVVRGFGDNFTREKVDARKYKHEYRRYTFFSYD